MTQAIVYLPLTRHDFSLPPGGGITIVARGHSAEDALGGVRSVVASMDPNLTLFNQQTLSEYLELIRSAMGSALRMFGGIGVFGLVLSAIGLAGVTGYAVAQRRKEIGIRMALGARNSQVLALVLREGAMLIAAGTVIGFLGAVALAKVLSAIASAFSDAFTVGVDDPRLLIGAPLLLAVLALVACYIPARRAARSIPSSPATGVDTGSAPPNPACHCSQLVNRRDEGTSSRHFVARTLTRWRQINFHRSSAYDFKNVPLSPHCCARLQPDHAALPKEGR